MGELHRVADCVDPVLFARQLSARALVSKYSSNGHHSQANPVNKILG